MKRLVTLLCLVLAASALGAQSDADWFWGKPIAGFQWEGISHADRRELDSATKSYIGKPFSEELWMELQAKLYELDWFEKIDPSALPADEGKTRVYIKFIVAEKSSVESVRVTGNSGLRTNEILDVVTVKAGDIYNQSKARVDELAIRRLYLEKGYPDASVSTATTQGTEPRAVVLSFSVVEGSQVAVKEVRFTGNSAVSAQALKGQVGIKEAGLFQSGAFQESKLEEGKRALIDYYKSRGYVDVAVADVIRSYEKDAKSGRTYLILTFVIKENLQWTYGGISFEGNQIFSNDKLSSLVSQKQGGILNYKKLLQDKQRVDDLYYESGYIFNTIDLVEKRDEGKGSISYVVKVAERDRAHIESIAFKGNTKTKDFVLYREMPLEVGDIFSKAKVIEGLRNLYNLQYFSAVEPEMFPGSADNLMNLVVNVEEQSTADIQFGITLSGFGEPDTFPLSGLVKWNDRNFLGKGQDFGVELNASPSSQTLTFSFQDNWLFGKRFSGGVDLSFAHKTKTTGTDMVDPIFYDDDVPDPYTISSDDGYSLSDIPSAYRMPYTAWDFSLGFSAGRVFHTPIVDLGLGGGYTASLEMDTYDVDKYRPYSADLREDRGEWKYGNKFLLRGYLNDLDLWYNPSKGYYASQRFTWTGVFSWENQHYIKSETRLEAYATLFNIPVFEGWNFKWILGGHTGFTALMAKPWTDLVVDDDWLYIDGTFNARGWSSLYGKEGTGLWDNWLELRMPIFEQFLWLDAFLDVAALGTQSGLLDMTLSTIAADTSRSDFSSLGWDNLACSLGFGFRFAISQFPFRFYFAKRFTFDGSDLNWKTSGLDFVISITQPLY